MNLSTRSPVAGPGLQPRPPRRVVLALPPESLPTVSLLRAQALATLWRAELHVVRVLAVQSTSFPLFPHLNSVVALNDAAHRLDGLEATEQWLSAVLGDTSEVSSLELRLGDFVEQVSEHALELAAELIVLPPAEGHFGAMVTALAQAAQTPVLVARAPTSSDDIVAASDLQDERYPVLHKAAELGARLNAPVVAVHNVAPMTMPADQPELLQVMASATDELTAERREQLQRAATHLGAHAEAVISRRLSGTEAVLELARSRDADLVVVGTREAPALPGLLGGHFAADVVQRSRRSVLVVPIND